jgi:para-aminobenzoate synthetase/4-amino-4-deoxychorismate lyase
MQPIDIAATTPKSVLLVTSRVANESRESYLFTNPHHVFIAHTYDDLPALFREIDAAPGNGLYAAGYLGYECGYGIEPSLLAIAPAESSVPLAWFGFYQDAIKFNYQCEPRHFTPPLPSLDISKDEYFDKFANIKSHIKAGNTYQVNLTTRLKFNTPDLSALFTHLMAVQPVEFGAFINLDGIHVLSASPELFFRRRGTHIVARPMKGTAPRGFSIAEQNENARWLANDEKNQSENVMIVDLLRNDLRRICQVNTVNVEKLFDIETFPTVLQMVSTVTGQLRPEVTYSDIFRSLFPCGSITGAPKVRTMQIIRQLETHPRDVYTGSIGFIAPHDEAVFNVAIRTIVSQKGECTMGIGGGIVWNSDPQEEYDECRLKGAFLNRSSAPFQLIETILWDGDYKFLQQHMSRLVSSAEYFEFLCDTKSILSRLQTYSSPHRVRVLLSRDGTFEITATPITTASNVTACISKYRTDANDLFLRHKTTRRALYDSEFSQTQSKGYDDVVFLNSDGFVTEGAIHNIFVVKSGLWLTPPVTDGVLPGILRQSLLQTKTCIERQMCIDDLMSADEIYLGNSVRGLRRARLDLEETLP